MSRPKPFPQPLKPGARVGVVALSGPADPAALESGLAFLVDEGFVPVEAPNLRDREDYLAGSDAARLAGLETVLDAGVEGLWAVRGGYGLMRLLPMLPWERLSKWEGWVVGFSDVTALHAALSRRYSFATLHAPMVQSLRRHPPSTGATLALLRGEPAWRLLDVQPEDVVRPGRARGVAVGGNLAVLAALAGTPFEPDYGGGILFLEDVGEPMYRLDRMLTQLRLSSKLSRVHAVVAGRLAQCGRGEAGWRSRWRTLVSEVAPGAEVVLEGLQFGHGTANWPIPLGAEVEVDSAAGVMLLGGV